MIIIDTDPGIDDAIAILFALHSPLEILGITTVAGNIGLAVTTRNAGRILALGGHSVPVYSGADKPLVRPGISEARIHGEDGLGAVDFPEPERPGKTGAVEFMAEALMANPAQSIDILALAPLTNIATLIRHAPMAARKIRRLIAMGGAIDEPGNVGPKAEFNMASDPEAAQIVLAANLPLTLVPLDVTRKVRADATFITRLRGLETAQATAVADLIAAYFTGTTGGTSRPLHDPCVPLLALHPHLFPVQAMDLAIDQDGALTKGPNAVSVAMGVDAAAVLDVLARGLA